DAARPDGDAEIRGRRHERGAAAAAQQHEPAVAGAGEERRARLVGDGHRLGRRGGRRHRHSLCVVRAEDRGRVEVQGAAVSGDEYVAVVLDLAPAAVAAGLDHALRERREAPHVVRGELAATGVAGQVAAGPEPAVGDERAALALRAEAVVLEGDEDGVRVAVVELEDVDVGELDTRLAQRELAGPRRAGVDRRLAPGPRRIPGRALAEAAQVHRRL